MFDATHCTMVMEISGLLKSLSISFFDILLSLTMSLYLCLVSFQFTITRTVPSLIAINGIVLVFIVDCVEKPHQVVVFAPFVSSSVGMAVSVKSDYFSLCWDLLWYGFTILLGGGGRASVCFGMQSCGFWCQVDGLDFLVL